MKRICTQILAFCLLMTAQNLNAQTCNTSSTNPNPTPAFGAPLTVSTGNGFTSNQTTVGSIPKNQTTVITSPAYHYNSSQSTIYFDYNLTKSLAGTTTAAPTITILYGSGFSLSFSCTGSVYTFPDGTADVYFSITPGSAFPPGTDFKIQISITLTSSDKALVANSLSTNAILSGAGAPLPVTFAGFYAKQISNGVSLTWNVGVEQNLSGYELQRSADGTNFSKIGFVAASGNSSYSFIDSKPSATSYYRIKSIDVDGKYAYSIVVSLKGQQSAVVMKAFPMPVKDQVTIQHGSVISNSGKIEIISADGRLVKSIALSTGVQETNVNLSTAKAGVYIVRFDNGNGQTETLKLIKQ
jgi:Secretion system C-terminal sorting domain